MQAAHSVGSTNVLRWTAFHRRNLVRWSEWARHLAPASAAGRAAPVPYPRSSFAWSATNCAKVRAGAPVTSSTVVVTSANSPRRTRA